MKRERADIFPVRLYNEERDFIRLLAERSHTTKSEIVREIIRQYRVEAETEYKKVKDEIVIKGVSDDHLYEIIIRRKN